MESYRPVLPLERSGVDMFMLASRVSVSLFAAAAILVLGGPEYGYSQVPSDAGPDSMLIRSIRSPRSEDAVRRNAAFDWIWYLHQSGTLRTSPALLRELADSLVAVAATHTQARGAGRCDHRNEATRTTGGDSIPRFHMGYAL